MIRIYMDELAEFLRMDEKNRELWDKSALFNSAVRTILYSKEGITTQELLELLADVCKAYESLKEGYVYQKKHSVPLCFFKEEKE